MTNSYMCSNKTNWL